MRKQTIKVLVTGILNPEGLIRSIINYLSCNFRASAESLKNKIDCEPMTVLSVSETRGSDP